MWTAGIEKERRDGHQLRREHRPDSGADGGLRIPEPSSRLETAPTRLRRRRTSPRWRGASTKVCARGPLAWASVLGPRRRRRRGKSWRCSAWQAGTARPCTCTSAAGWRARGSDHRCAHIGRAFARRSHQQLEPVADARDASDHRRSESARSRHHDGSVPVRRRHDGNPVGELRRVGEWPDERFGTIEWPVTGERLTRETFQKYRARGGPVIGHNNTDEMVAVAINSPLTAIASDGYMGSGIGHPRTSGTYSKVLGRYVREAGSLSLMEALRKMTLMPARRLEARVPAMGGKGRIRAGADADLTIFDPARVVDRSTSPRAEPSTGRHSSRPRGRGAGGQRREARAGRDAGPRGARAAPVAQGVCCVSKDFSRGFRLQAEGCGGRTSA